MEHFFNNFVRGKNVYFACFQVEKRKKQEKKSCFCATECVLFIIVSLPKHFQKIVILTWHRGHCDQQGSSPRSRLFHCTSVELKPAIPPNVGNSGA